MRYVGLHLTTSNQAELSELMVPARPYRRDWITSDSLITAVLDKFPRFHDMSEVVAFLFLLLIALISCCLVGLHRISVILHAHNQH